MFEPEFLAEHRPGGMVYFTDGEGPYHASSPGVPVLWVLTKDRPFRCPWGQQTLMRGKGDAHFPFGFRKARAHS